MGVGVGVISSGGSMLWSSLVSDPAAALFCLDARLACLRSISASNLAIILLSAAFSPALSEYGLKLSARSPFIERAGTVCGLMLGGTVLKFSKRICSPRYDTKPVD